MPTNYPTSLDTLANPSGANTLASPSHAGQHADINDAMEAVQTKVGIGADFLIDASAAGAVPLTVKGAASQTANLIEILGSDGTIVARFKAPGVEDGLLHVQHTFTNAPTATYSGVRSQMVAKGTATVSNRTMAVRAEVTDHASTVNVTISGAANNGSGLIRITSATHGWATGDKIAVYAVGGTTEANGAWTITVINSTTFDLQGSTFTNTYTSGGTATNRPMMTAFSAVVAPTLDRGSLTGTAAAGDDVNGVTVANTGDSKATEAFYVADSAGVTGSGWFSAFTSNSDADYAFLVGANDYATAIVDLRQATSVGAGGAIRLPHNVSVTALAAGGSTVQLFKMSTSDRFSILTTQEWAASVVLGTGTGSKIGTATTQKLGFWNATPVVQPSANADTSGATLGQLETEVNELKALLRTIGLMAP